VTRALGCKCLCTWPHGSFQYDEEPRKKRASTPMCIFWVLNFIICIFGGFLPYNKILMVFYAYFGRFLPKTKDLEPFFRPELGRKLGGEPTQDLNNSEVFDSSGGLD